MTIPLRNFPEGQRKSVAVRRVTGKTGGLGFVSAKEYLALKHDEELKLLEEKENTSVPGEVLGD